MSEMEHKKAKLIKVLDGRHEPVNIQLWLGDKWSVYYDKEDLDQEFAYGILQDHFLEQDWNCNYYLFDDELYTVESERTLDEYGYVEAVKVFDGIEIDAFWYNGGGSFEECVTEGLKKLEGEIL